MDQWTNGPLEQSTNDPMVQWTHGPHFNAMKEGRKEGNAGALCLNPLVVLTGGLNKEEVNIYRMLIPKSVFQPAVPLPLVTFSSS